MSGYYYNAFGLNILSELRLPELLTSTSKKVDVTIKYGSVPDSIQNPKSKGILFEASPNEFLFKLESVGSYYVTNGNSIIIQPHIKSSVKDLRAFLLSSSIGAIIHQKGLLPLHGSSIKINDKSIVIVGKSTSGKSSLAAGFKTKGYQVLADDITVVTNSADNTSIVYPGIPYLKLWRNVLDHLTINSNLERVRPEMEKYRLMDTASAYRKPLPIAKILVLSPSKKRGFSYEKINGINKFNTLLENTFRINFVGGLGKTEAHFHNISKLSNSVDIYRVFRPISPLQIDELVQYIEDEILFSL